MIHDRRVAVRHDSAQATPCHFALSDEVQCRWAKVRDISRSGVALEMDMLFNPGTRLIIELPARTYQQIRPVPARVIRVQELENGFWLIGCAFDWELSSSDEQALL